MHLQFCGVVLLALGIWGRVSDDNYLEEIVTSNKDALDATYVICIVVGLVLFLIGFLGCCGACTENRLMLILVSGKLLWGQTLPTPSSQRLRVHEGD